jgi:hypothetical protein
LPETNKEKQPSQEPEDDDEELGPCGFLVCDEAKLERLACCHCEMNPENQDWDDEV